MKRPRADGTWIKVPYPADLTFGTGTEAGTWEGANHGEDYETYQFDKTGYAAYDVTFDSFIADAFEVAESATLYKR